MASKWIDNRSVLLSSSAFEGMNDRLSAQRRKKGSKTKSSILCPKVIKLYNSSMDGVDLELSVLPHIVWIESNLLDFTTAFSLI